LCGYFESGILNKKLKDRVVNENALIVKRFIERSQMSNVYSYFAFCKDITLGTNYGKNKPKSLIRNNFYSLFVACGILIVSSFILYLMEISWSLKYYNFKYSSRYFNAVIRAGCTLGETLALRIIVK